MKFILLGVVLDIVYFATLISIMSGKYSQDAIGQLIIATLVLFIPGVISLLHGLKQFFFSEITEHLKALNQAIGQFLSRNEIPK